MPSDRKAYPSVDDAWKKFVTLFSVMGGILNYQPVFEEYVKLTLDRLVADNVQHVEIRACWDDRVYTLNQTQKPVGYLLNF